MSAANPIAVSEEEPFVIGKSDLAYFFNNFPYICNSINFYTTIIVVNNII